MTAKPSALSPRQFVLNGHDWSGKSGRVPFILISLICTGLFILPGRMELFSLQYIAAIIALSYFFLLFWGYVRRRMRDVGLSGWWVWVLFVPVLGTALILYLALKGGNPSLRQIDSPSSKAGIGLAVLASLVLVSRIFWAPYGPISGSMKPTLLVGDYIAVVSQENPDRGDVIVFKHPKSGHTYIKRLIGLPGDNVQMSDGVVQIDGALVQVREDGTFEELMERQGAYGIRPACENAPVGEGGKCIKSRKIETFPGGKEHAILNIRYSNLDDTGVFSVPEGHYFFMGDNRDNSVDSRVAQQAGGIGFVPEENLIGRADRIVFSAAGRSILFFWAWRSDRFFKKIL